MIDNLLEECINIVDGETFYEKTLYDCPSYSFYIGLFVSFLVMTVISGIFIYFYWYKKKNSDADHCQLFEHWKNKLLSINGNKIIRNKKQILLFLG